MKIKLITQTEYNTLLEIQKSNPTLTYQNSGFNYINPKKLTEDDKIGIVFIEDILNHSIDGFVKFNNFKIFNNGAIGIRFQYHYDTFFTGVGYIEIKELLNGFNQQ